MEHDAHRIKFESMGIGSILSESYLHVPPNQRSYKWDDTHVTELFQDLNAVAGDQEYFLGTIVMSEHETGLRIADGQQRLATVSVLLAAIRDYFLGLGPEELWRVSQIEETYLIKRHFRTGSTQPKLTLNSSDHDYFLKRIISRPGVHHATAERESHRRLATAASKAADHVASIVANRGRDDAINRLAVWVTWLEKSVLVIRVTAPENFSVFRIFETLNDRGLDLSEADLIKNYLFDKAGGRLKEAEQKWSAMEAVIETMEGKNDRNLLDYIRHLFVTQHGHTIQKDLDSRVKEQIKGQQSAMDFCGLLAKHARDYAAIHTSEHEQWREYGTETRRHIVAIRRHLQVEQITPLMLAVAMQFTPKEATKAFRLFVNWSVRFLIVGGRGGKLDKNYADAAHKIGTGEVKKTGALVELLKDTIPSDAEFRLAFSTARVTRSHIARYYLHAIERHLKGPDDTYVPNEDEAVVNLEHVLPRNPDPAWGLSIDIAEALYPRIGNMVLLRAEDNVAAGSAPFVEKKKYLSRSLIVTTSWLSKETRWDEEAIQRRQEKLAEYAVETWPIA